MRICFRYLCALRARLSRLPILVLLLVSALTYADTPVDNVDSDASPVIMASDTVSSGFAGTGTGAVSYWVLAFLLAFNVAGVIHMRRWATSIESRNDKE